MKKRFTSLLCIISILILTCMVPMQAVNAAPPTLPNLTQAQMNSAYSNRITSLNHGVNLRLSATQPERLYAVQISSANSNVELGLYNIRPGYNYDVALYNSSGQLVTNKNSTASLVATMQATNAGDPTGRVFLKTCYPDSYFVRIFSRDGNFSTSGFDFSYYASNYSSYQLNMPRVAQRQDQWSWAAAAEMIGKWIVQMESDYINSTSKTQENCVSFLGTGNYPMPSPVLASGIDYMTQGTLASSRGTSVVYRSFLPFEINEQVYECRRGLGIKEHNPYYGSSHYLVVYGANVIYDTLYLNDPWTPPINGAVKPCVYREVSRQDIIVNGDYANSSHPRYYTETIQRNDW